MGARNAGLIAELHQVIGLMAEDKSNDWSEEIEVIDRAIEALTPAPTATHDSRCTLDNHHEGECNWREFKG